MAGVYPRPGKMLIALHEEMEPKIPPAPIYVLVKMGHLSCGCGPPSLSQFRKANSQSVGRSVGPSSVPLLSFPDWNKGLCGTRGRACQALEFEWQTLARILAGKSTQGKQQRREKVALYNFPKERNVEQSHCLSQLPFFD